MRIIIREAIWSFKQNLKSNILLILQLSICFWLICMLSNTFFDMGFKNYYKDFTKNGKIYYQLSLAKSSLLFMELVDGNNETENVRRFIEELKNQEDFLYTKYTATDDLVLKKYKLEEKGLTAEKLNNFISIDNNDPNLINLKSLQMDKEGFEHFNFDIYQGRGFSEDDYILESTSDKLSVILGNDYKDIFKIGDEIEFKYAEKPFKGTIIGVLKEDSNIYNSSTEATYLDDQIIIPLVNLGYLPINETDKLLQATVYNSMLTGANIIMDIDSNNIEISKIIYELCNQYGIMKYEPSINTSTNGLDVFKNETRQAVKIILTMVIVMIIFSLFTFIMNIYNKIEKNMRRYLIQILQGASIKYILMSYLLEVFIIIISSLGISSYLLKNEISISYKFLLLLGLLITIVSIVVCSAIVYKLKNLNSDKLLRRE